MKEEPKQVRSNDHLWLSPMIAMLYTGMFDMGPQAFVHELLGEKALGDRKVFKRIVKAFCGGKKKSTRGMPSK